MFQSQQQRNKVTTEEEIKEGELIQKALMHHKEKVNTNFTGRNSTNVLPQNSKLSQQT